MERGSGAELACPPTRRIKDIAAAYQQRRRSLVPQENPDFDGLSRAQNGSQPAA